MEHQRIRDIGAAAGNVGTDEDVVMENSPLQLRVGGAHLNQLNNMADPKKLEEMCLLQDKELKKREEIISGLSGENKKLEAMLMDLKRELQESGTTDLLEV